MILLVQHLHCYLVILFVFFGDSSALSPLKALLSASVHYTRVRQCKFKTELLPRSNIISARAGSARFSVVKDFENSWASSGITAADIAHSTTEKYLRGVISKRNFGKDEVVVSVAQEASLLSSNIPQELSATLHGSWCKA